MKLRAETSQQFNESTSQRFWLHAASLGEFEQGRPVLEALRKNYPNCKIILTFFSPSGYEVRKDWEGADVVCYLPLDSPANARDFIGIIKPSLAIFVKYEFWYYYLATLAAKKIPAIIISAAFREGQPFFRWWGGLWRKMLGFYEAVFVQDAAGEQLIRAFAKEVIIAGDTRYDRVMAHAAGAKHYPAIAAFVGEAEAVIAGSTWPRDEAMLAAAAPVLTADGRKLIIAPHEVDKANIERIKQLFGDAGILYSALIKGSAAGGKAVLIIDNIGMLAALYQYGAMAYVGGGFDKGGIHNILEPAAYGLPVIFGPRYGKFVEAVEMTDAGLAFPVGDVAAFIELLNRSEGGGLSADNEAMRAFMRRHAGATHTILTWIGRREIVG